MKKLKKSGFFFAFLLSSLHKSVSKNKLQNGMHSAIILVVSWLSFWYMRKDSISEKDKSHLYSFGSAERTQRILYPSAAPAEKI